MFHSGHDLCTRVNQSQPFVEPEARHCMLNGFLYPCAILVLRDKRQQWMNDDDGVWDKAATQVAW